LEEGAPGRSLCEDTQALPTERGSHSYGLATAPPARALLYNQWIENGEDRNWLFVDLSAAIWR
jgi:hypothetical protein